MTTPPGSLAGPEQYHLLTPADWWRVPLRDPVARLRSVKALVHRQLPVRDQHVQLRRDLTEQLRQQAWEAAAAGGLEMYISVQLGGIPVAATLTSYLVPAVLEEGAVAFRDMVGDRGGDVDNVSLPMAGPAVRRRYRRDPQGTPAAGIEGAPTTVVVDYWVEVPDQHQTLQLTFSSPLQQIEDTMVELFDTIAASLRWGGDR
jgi:hypothetical protein